MYSNKKPASSGLSRTSAMIALSAATLFGTTYHVAKTGLDANHGAPGAPFLTIGKAAQIAQPGDSIIVHAGTYREWVQPPRGGTSENTRITYKAAAGDIVEIKGSETWKTWVSQGNGVWRADVPDAFFGSNGNPFAYDIQGRYPGEGSQYLFCASTWCHLGDVFLNGKILLEKQFMTNMQQTQMSWYVSHSGATTSIYANFGPTADPTTQFVEINARECVFGNPSNGSISYITVDGFQISQSAEEWCPPYRSSPAISPSLVNTSGTNWIIQNCRIKFAKMRGICCDRGSGTTPTNHIVRNCVITDCGVAGIAGDYENGNIFSGNWIADIGLRPYCGDEEGFIKQNRSRNITICGNVLYNMRSSSGKAFGITLDWPSNGWRITGNFLMNASMWLIDCFNMQGAGNVLVDNNVFVGNPDGGNFAEVHVNNLYVPNMITGNGIYRNNMSLSSAGQVVDTAARTVTLTLNISSTLANQDNAIAATSTLGTVNMAPVTNSDGSAVTINYDMLNRCRIGAAKSGPFQNITAGINTFVFRPNNDFMNRSPCSSTQSGPMPQRHSIRNSPGHPKIYDSRGRLVMKTPPRQSGIPAGLYLTVKENRISGIFAVATCIPGPQ